MWADIDPEFWDVEKFNEAISEPLRGIDNPGAAHLEAEKKRFEGTESGDAPMEAEPGVDSAVDDGEE